MPDLIIHVGYGRTATSLLQNRVFPRLERVNYLGKTADNYPEWLIRWHYLDDLGFEQQEEEIQRQLNSLLARDSANLVSSEAFTLQGGNILNQARRIKAIAPQARIILVLRHPIDYLKSLYKYYVKAEGLTKPLREVLDWHRTPMVFHKRKLIYLPDLFYSETIRLYSRLFGKDGVCILKYEDMVANPDDYFGQMGSFLGACIEPGLYQKALAAKDNASPAESELNRLRSETAYNQVKSMFPRAGQKVSPEDFLLESELMSGELETKLREYYRGRCYDYL